MLAPSPVPRQLVTKPLFACFPVWGGGDVNVPVNLLTSCMLRELRGCQGYIILYIHNITQGKSHLDTYIYIYVFKHVHTYRFIFTIIYCTYNCTYFLVYIYAHKYTSHLFTYIYISYVYI